MNFAQLIDQKLVQIKDYNGQPIGWGSVVQDTLAENYMVVVPHEGEVYAAHCPRRIVEAKALFPFVFSSWCLNGPLYCGRHFTAIGMNLNLATEVEA